MQTKKEELRADIISAAEREFLCHGYRNGSMRSIAKRANTTIGNIYHYFPNKEALLDEIIGTLPEELETVISTHQELAADYADFNVTVEDIVATPIADLFPIDLLLSPRFLIYLGKSEGTKYDASRQQLIQLLNAHLKWHMRLKEDSLLTETLLHTVLSSLLFIGTRAKNLEEGRKQLFEYIKVVSMGFPFGTIDKQP